MLIALSALVISVCACDCVLSTANSSSILTCTDERRRRPRGESRPECLRCCDHHKSLFFCSSARACLTTWTRRMECASCASPALLVLSAVGLVRHCFIRPFRMRTLVNNSAVWFANGLLLSYEIVTKVCWHSSGTIVVLFRWCAHHSFFLASF